MTSPLRRIAAGLSLLAAAFLLVAALLPADANAQSPPQKRAAPTGKAKAVRPAAASGWVGNPAVDGRDAYIILDATSGRELSSDQPDQLRHPASLTKLMTIYLTFSALDSGRLSLGDGLPVSINALNAPPTKMGLPPGGTVSVRDATMALVTRSANDAAVVLAEALGGDEATFAQMMTSKARQLGMSQTVFRNASGLPNREQVTTARDMARLAFALMRDFPHYYPVFSVQSWPYRGRILENHNRMLGSYEGADGLKTGYTNASGFNLVMSAMRDNRRLIGVVMGGDSAGQRDRMMAMLMDQGFASAATMRLSAWTNIRKPPSARYTSANFDPSLVIPESTPRLATASAQPLAGFTAAAPPPPPAPQPPASQRVAGPAAPPPRRRQRRAPAARRSAAGSSRSARSTIRRPPSSRWSGRRRRWSTCRSVTAAVDEVQMANKTFHRARLTNLSQAQAVDGCKRLEKKKIYCSAIQVTAWNTPNAR